MFKKSFSIVVLVFAVALSQATTKKPAAQTGSPRFEISFAKEMSAAPIDGHVLLLIANNNEKEPRFQVSFMTAESQQVFGVDVDGLAPGTPAVVDASTLGYPLKISTMFPPATTGCRPFSTSTRPFTSAMATP